MSSLVGGPTHVVIWEISCISTGYVGISIDGSGDLMALHNLPDSLNLARKNDNLSQQFGQN